MPFPRFRRVRDAEDTGAEHDAAVPDLPPDQESKFYVVFGTWTTIVHGVVPLARADDGWNVVFGLLGVIIGLGLVGIWFRSYLSFRSWVRAHETPPPERPPWA